MFTPIEVEIIKVWAGFVMGCIAYILFKLVIKM